VRRCPRSAVFFALVVLLPTGTLGSESVEEFVRRHWAAPLAPQGPAPARFTGIESSLQPDACGSCHPTQAADWSTSLHAAAMGPGVSGQIVEMLERDAEQAVGCFTCHAPLAEQAPVLRRDGVLRANPDFDAALMAKGLPCAGCHVRAHERFGPPRRDGSLGSAAPRETLPHGGVTRTPAFVASEFCRSCHQFSPEGLALNGKLLEDTFNEWKASKFARDGVQCQDCHMPDRRHLWRGIHDPEMVRSGLAITVQTGAARYRVGETAAVTLHVHSVRVGHRFPTYVTPLVVLRGELLDPTGAVIPESRRERLIGREVTLDLAREIADTRLRPGERASLVYRPRLDRAGLRARVSVVVYPDAFYTRFFETLLQQGAGRGEARIREALAATRRSPFTVFVKEVPLS
jgi:Cytochrome c554 and c-prime